MVPTVFKFKDKTGSVKDKRNLKDTHLTDKVLT